MKKLTAELFKMPVDVLDNLEYSRDDDISEDHMASLRDELNNTKTLMDEYYHTPKCPDYDVIQNNLDLYRNLRWILKSKYNAQYVTNAWMKYYEIYSAFNLLPEKLDRPLVAFCNAELPGASICALNHYVACCRSYPLDWYASSIVLDKEMLDNLDTSDTGKLKEVKSALGDQYGLWDKNRDRWLMNENNNGDATNIKNILDWENKLGPKSKYGGVDLYSHDAGIYVEDDFNSQEVSNMRIHLGCALSGFLTLRAGGMFVAKQYTFFHPMTYTLIAVYATMFENFYIAKPLTSRPFNSEIYLIGERFIGITNNQREYLTNLLVDFKEASVCKMPAGTRKMIVDAAAKLQKQQCDFIKQNVEYYKIYCKRSRNMNGLFDKLRNSLLDEWIKNHPICKINPDKHLAGN